MTIESGAGTYPPESGAGLTWVLVKSSTTSDIWTNLYRTGMSFNTSEIPDNATITSVILSMSMYTNSSTAYLPTEATTVTNFTPANLRSYVPADYSVKTDYILSSYSFNSYPANYPAPGSTRINFSISAFDYINKTGYMSFMLRSANDTLKVAPKWVYSNPTYQRWYTGLQSNNANKPFSEIKYTFRD